LFQCVVCLSAVLLILFAVESCLCTMDQQRVLLQFCDNAVCVLVMLV